MNNLQKPNHSHRLMYRVILKTLTSLAVLILLVVLVNSLFISKSEPENASVTTNDLIPVMLDITAMIKGEIRKAKWQGKEVAVLYRKKSLVKSDSVKGKVAHPSLNKISRSITLAYFVYINKGDSGNCPLFYVDDTFKDVCSSTLFNSTGRKITNLKQGFKLNIPPHYFEAETLIIGVWQK